MSRARLRNTSTVLSPRVSSEQIRLKSRLNCSESTAGSLRKSGSEFQTVGPATEKARVPKVPRRTRGGNNWPVAPPSVAYLDTSILVCGSEAVYHFLLISDFHSLQKTSYSVYTALSSNLFIHLFKSGNWALAKNTRLKG